MNKELGHYYRTRAQGETEGTDTRARSSGCPTTAVRKRFVSRRERVPRVPPPPGRMPGQEQDRTVMMLARGRGNALRALPSHTSPDHRDSCPCQKITTALTPELSALFPHVWPENL